MCDVTQRHDVVSIGHWRRHQLDTTHWYVTWLIDMWRVSLIRDVTHWNMTWLIDTWRDPLMTWPIDMWYQGTMLLQLPTDMTHWYVTWLVDMWRDSLTFDMTRWYVTWLIDVWHDSLIWHMTHWYVTWLIDMWHDSLICDMTHWYVTWLIDIAHNSLICNMTPGHDIASVGHWRQHQGADFVGPTSWWAYCRAGMVPWLICVWYDLFIWDVTHLCVTWLIHACRVNLVMSPLPRRYGAMTDFCVLYDSLIWDMTHYLCHD